MFLQLSKSWNRKGEFNANHVDHQSGGRDDRDSIQCLAPLDQKRNIPVLCPGRDEVFDQSGAAGGISKHPGRQCHPATGGGLMGCRKKKRPPDCCNSRTGAKRKRVVRIPQLLYPYFFNQSIRTFVSLLISGESGVSKWRKSRKSTPTGSN